MLESVTSMGAYIHYWRERILQSWYWGLEMELGVVKYAYYTRLIILRSWCQFYANW